MGGLAHVAQSGEAIYLDVAQIDAMASPLAPILLDPLVNGDEYHGRPNDVPGSWFSGTYQCLGQDAWIAIDLEGRDGWRALCRFLDREDLQVETAQEASARREELEIAFVVWVLERTSHSAAHLLQKAGIPAVPVQDIEDLWHDPQLRSRECIVAMDQPDYGVVHYPQSAFRLSRTPGRLTSSGPRLGEHTYQILSDWMGGLDPARFAELQSLGAVFQA
jgi:crotonobetainyl-CoA:carnitine CoA-transferase CaiB-like acyl-CoA transferase